MIFRVDRWLIVSVLVLNTVAKFTLPTGETVLVDDTDFDKVNQHRWHIEGPGYVGRTYRQNGKMCHEYLHHFIFGIKIKLDHNNLNRLDNQRQNLRPANDSQNQANRFKSKGQYSSRFKGVYLHKNSSKWMARIGPGGNYYLGLFPDEIEAAKAYNAAALEIYGKYAQLNPV